MISRASQAISGAWPGPLLPQIPSASSPFNFLQTHGEQPAAPAGSRLSQQDPEPRPGQEDEEGISQAPSPSLEERREAAARVLQARWRAYQHQVSPARAPLPAGPALPVRRRAPGRCRQQYTQATLGGRAPWDTWEVGTLLMLAEEQGDELPVQDFEELTWPVAAGLGVLGD